MASTWSSTLARVFFLTEMHRYLSILDIPVFEEDVISRNDLAQLARACETFSGPTIDLLWRELDDLSALSACMGPDIWKDTGLGTLLRQNLSQEKFVTSDHWFRLMCYADRVKTLRTFPEDTHNPDALHPSRFTQSAVGAPILSAPTLLVVRNIKKLMTDIDDPDT
ncbi:hypothetical protein PLICRDRAFT_382011 [Plicaturopsis crispa FD-325 SS-3]|nr:hypothetical protein PLICRDRAFT_382011 [Plicaturopsis crispa FD-325 SS-3]